MTMQLLGFAVFFLVTFLPWQVLCSGPLMINVKENPVTPIRLHLSPEAGQPPLSVMFTFKTCRNVDIIRFYHVSDNSLIGSVSLRDSYLGFCMERPNRCENSEVRLTLNEWHLVKISPLGASSGQILFETFVPNGAFRMPTSIESRKISFSSSYAAAPGQGVFAEVPASFRGCLSPSLGFDLSYIARSDYTQQFLTPTGNCFMDIAWPPKSDRRAYAGECYINVTCDDGNVCQHCRVDEPGDCNCVPPYRSTSEIQEGGTVVTKCSMMASSSPCRSNPCRSGGTCIVHVDRQNASSTTTSFKCLCPPLFTGELCDTPIDSCRPNPCLNNGICIKDAETGKPTCQCRGTGFEGQFCENDVDECSVPNVIACSPDSSLKCYNLPGSYWCRCKDGYTNQTCSDLTDPCADSQCLNGASCVALRKGSTEYKCTCPAGFGGKLCEISYSTCNNFTCPFPNSVCYSSNIGSTTCMCRSDFSLSKDKNVCFASDPCRSMPCRRGICKPVNPFDSNEVVCQCPPGYTGQYCESMVNTCQSAANPCRNNGTCIPSVGSFSCSCPKGFEPPYCNPIDYCSLDVCELNGSQSVGCINDPPGYRCRCRNGWTGSTCTTPIDACANKPCLNGGYCQVTKPGGFKCVCPAGYSGRLCFEHSRSSLCESNKCLNGGTCRLGYGPYEVCQCTPGWIGLACETRDPCHPNPCGPNGQCYELQDPKSGYRCRCYDGWKGTNCTVRDPNALSRNRTIVGCQNDAYCEPGGRCRNGRCECNRATFNLTSPLPGVPSRFIEVGWSGERCQEPTIPDPCAEYPPICKNGARCTRTENSLGFFCNCGRVMSNTEFQYTGGRCEAIMGQYCHLSRCQNGGTCIPNGNSATCLCPSGYTGKNCEHQVSICNNQGGKSPCLNGGTCIQSSSDDPSQFACQCLAGFSGTFCEAWENLCIPNPCRNDGVCSSRGNLSQQTTSFTCNCSHTGFTGPTCEEELNLCATHACQNGGTCIQDKGRTVCRCLEGFGGAFCQEPLNPCLLAPCQGSARCVQNDAESAPLSYSCICPAGTTGQYCEQEINYCSNVSCNHGGSCINEGHSFKCICQPGFTGEYCEMDIDECKLFSPCAQSGAPCRNTMGSYECDCNALSDQWLDGKNCTVSLTGCSGENHCMNGGTCFPRLEDEERNVHGFYCICSQSWTGEFCQIRNTVSFTGNSSMNFSKSSKELPHTLSFGLRTTIGDGPLLNIFVAGKNVFGDQPFFSLYLLRGYLRGHIYQRTQFAHPYKAANDDWTSVDVHIAANGTISVKVRQSLCDFPYCQSLSYSDAPAGFFLSSFGNHVFDFVFGHHAQKEGFVGCLRSVYLNKDLMINSAVTQMINVHHDCRTSGLCSLESNQCNANGQCIDRWIRTDCKCNPGFDGPTCSQRLPKYTLGYVESIPKSIRFMPVSTFKYPLDFNVAFRSSPTTGNVSTQLLKVAFHSGSQSNVGFLLILKDNRLLINENEVYSDALKAGEQHLLTFSVTPKNQRNVISVKINNTLVSSYQTRLSGSILLSILLGEAKQRLVRRETIPLSAIRGYFVVDMVEVNGERLGTGTTTLGSLTVDTSQVYPNEYVKPTCRTRKPCLNGGICHNSMSKDFVCQCVKGYSGRTCEIPEPCDYVTCPNSMKCISPSARKAFCSGPISFDGRHEFVEYTAERTASVFDSRLQPFNIHFEFRTTQLNGILMFATARKTGQFFLLELKNGNLIMSQNILQRAGPIHTVRSISDGSWLNFDLGIFPSTRGRQLRVTVSRRNSGATLASGQFPIVNSPAFYASTKFSLFIGGIPNSEYSKQKSIFGSRWNMTLCMRNASYARVPLISIMPRTLSSRFETYKPASLVYGFDRLLTVSNRAVFSYDCPPASPCSISPDLAVCQNGGSCLPKWIDDYSCSCPPGFSGKYCQSLVSSCSPQNPCAGEDSICHDLLGGGYRCSCAVGRTGERCETTFETPVTLQLSNACDKAPCENGARCTLNPSAPGGYRCNCLTGFDGQNCSVSLSQFCSGNSEFPCLNNGICMNATVSSEANFSCSCINGFYGRVCEYSTDWCSGNRCMNGAKCVAQPQMQSYMCTCAPGYIGEYCETRTNFCASNPCSSRGSCINTEVGYNCSCFSGYYGANCQLRQADICASKPCQRGQCIKSQSGTSFTCDCSSEPGYHSETCRDIDECQTLSPCQNGGQCQNLVGDYNCTCALGFTGKNCTEVDCSSVNCRHGQCVDLGSQWRCECNQHYHLQGQFCTLPDRCAFKPCMNGTCIPDLESDSYRCECISGWLNQNCSTQNCSLTADYCNGGLCQMVLDYDQQWVAQCECPTGWTGGLCTEAIRIEQFRAEWIYAPILAAMCAALLIVAIVLFLRVKQKRATGGNYSPSRQEAIGTRVELEDIIKPPPEERLI